MNKTTGGPSALDRRKEYDRDHKMKHEIKLKKKAAKENLNLFSFLQDPASISLSEVGIERLSLAK